MVLLRLISWPYVRKHTLRTILTTAGIALGVAVFVGMNAANHRVLLAFSRTVDRIAGKTQLQVTAGETGFPEDVLERVQGVRSIRVAVPIIEAVVSPRLRREGSLLVLAVDLTGDRGLRDYDFESGEADVIDDPLVFLAQPDSIIVASEFAQKNGLVVGDPLAVGTMSGERRLIVRGIMKSEGLATAFGGNLAVMDVYAAQSMFGRGRTFDRIDLAVAEGHTISDAARELRAVLGPGFQVETPSARGAHFASMIAAYSLMMSASSAFALFIGIFIIYNSFVIAVTQRRREIGILRALGATRSQIRGLFLGESAASGFIGSLVGVAAGMLFARSLAHSVGTLVSEVYSVGQDTGAVATSPVLVLIAIGVGVATSVVGALGPARAAARVDPVQALQKGRVHMLARSEHRARAVLAFAGAVAAIVCLMAGRFRATFYASYVLAIMVVLALTPYLALALARIMRPVLKWMFPVEGALAADSLIQAPRRTSATVAALMLSLALVVAFAGMARASYGSIADWVETALNPDLFVAPSQDIAKKTMRFPAQVATELAGLPGVRVVQTVRQARVMFRGDPVMLVAVELSSLGRTTRVRSVEGDATEMFRLAGAGEGVMVADNLAQLRHLTLGETIELTGPAGILRLPIVGIVVDYSDQAGAILIDRAVFVRYWGDDSVNLIRVYLAPGAQPADVKQRILDHNAGRRQVFVLSNGELRSYILGLASQWFGLTYVQVAVAVLVGMLGIINTLIVSITDRRRELGVLRAVGGGHTQIRRTVWLEALGTAAVGIALGYLLGAINLYYVLQIVRLDVAGMRLTYEFPTMAALVVAPIMLAAAFLASVWPAESAVRGSLVEALEYE
jgi:putative ABC transport system permease protein